MAILASILISILSVKFDFFNILKSKKIYLNGIFGVTVYWLIISLIILISTIFHAGYKESYVGYFVLPVLFCPFIIVILSGKDLIKKSFLSLLLIFSSVITAILYWDYRDYPWFSNLPRDYETSEGKVFGWFSFENDLDWRFILIRGICSMLVGIMLYAIIFWCKKVLLKRKEITKQHVNDSLS